MLDKINIEILDKSNMLEFINDLPNQIDDSFKILDNVKDKFIDKYYKYSN